MPRITLEANRPPLEQLAEQGAILSYECNVEFNERHQGSAEVSVDLAAQPEPVIVFHGQDLRYRPQFLGSFSGIDDTFMWGWNNINGYPEAAVQVAGNLQSFGEQAGVREFVEPTFGVSGDADVYRLLFAAVRVTGTPAFYRMKTQHGFVYFLLYDYEMQPSRVVRTERAIMDAISGGWVDDHVSALQSYLEMRPGVQARGTETGLVITCSDGDLEITLDDQRRIAKTKYTVDESTVGGLRGGEPEA